MTVREIIKMQLQILDMDGLFNSSVGCGCEIDDLMPCSDHNDCADCEPGYKVPCPGDGECDCELGNLNTWHIVREK